MFENESIKWSQVREGDWLATGAICDNEGEYFVVDKIDHEENRYTEQTNDMEDVVWIDFDPEDTIWRRRAE